MESFKQFIEGKKKPKNPVSNNPVAKNARKFNTAQIMKDRKKAARKGYQKHKGQY